MIIVIGGGVFGLAIGWYLAHSGLKVTLIERGDVGQGATWSAAAMLMPWKLSTVFSQDLFNLQCCAHALWPQFARRLVDYSQVDIHYCTGGRYFVALDDKAVRRFRRQYNFHRQTDIPVEWLSGDEVRQRIPDLGDEIQAAIFSPAGHWIDARRMIAALRLAFQKAGGSLRERSAVQDVVIAGNRVQGVRLAQEMISADWVIVAAGAWSGQVGSLPQQLQSLVQPLKGQTLTLQMSAESPLIQQPIIGRVYLVPHQDGRLIVGTTVEEEAGFDARPTVWGIHDILSKAQTILPTIRHLPIIELGAGIRPSAANRLPIIGPTEVQGLLLATGGHAYGVLLSPIVAEAIRTFITEDRMLRAIVPFLPK